MENMKMEFDADINSIVEHTKLKKIIEMNS